MPLYCNREIHQALGGLKFPAEKDDILYHASSHGGMEGVRVLLNQLPKSTYHSVAEICQDVAESCSLAMARALSGAGFPATRDELMEFARRRGADPEVLHALEALPADRSYLDLAGVCLAVAQG